jgi:hypothetical protein
VINNKGDQIRSTLHFGGEIECEHNYTSSCV